MNDIDIQIEKLHDKGHDVVKKFYQKLTPDQKISVVRYLIQDQYGYATCGDLSPLHVAEVFGTSDEKICEAISRTLKET